MEGISYTFIKAVVIITKLFYFFQSTLAVYWFNTNHYYIKAVML